MITVDVGTGHQKDMSVCPGTRPRLDGERENREEGDQTEGSGDYDEDRDGGVLREN